MGLSELLFVIAISIKSLTESAMWYLTPEGLAFWRGRFMSVVGSGVIGVLEYGFLNWVEVNGEWMCAVVGIQLPG